MMKLIFSEERVLAQKVDVSQAGASTAYLQFSVPEDVYSIRVELEFNSLKDAQLPLALFDETGALRGIGVHEFTKGQAKQELWLALNNAGKGATPGAIASGKWSCLLYGRYQFEDITCRINVFVEMNTQNIQPRTLKKRNLKQLNPKAGWYSGELHMHSSESTGRTDVQSLVDAAAAQNLDFIAVTDHFTIGHWDKIDKVQGDEELLIIQSCELSGERGHANLHGIDQWISPFVDVDADLAVQMGLENYSMNSAADMVHDQGGLFCINHPLSGKVGWRYEDFIWEKADMIEIVGLPDGPNSFLYPVFWDRLLCSGQRIVGIGSSDSHDPFSTGPWKLGMLKNWVYADGLNERDILDGLKSGRVCVTYGDTRMNFTAEISGDKNSWSYTMGDTIPGGTEVVFTVSLMNNPKGNLYIVKDGLIFDIIAVQAAAESDSWQDIEFSYTSSGAGKRTGAEVNENDSYFRVEFHEEIVEPFYVNMAYRDHTSFRALSNPIWLNQVQQLQSNCQDK